MYKYDTIDRWDWWFDDWFEIDWIVNNWFDVDWLDAEWLDDDWFDWTVDCCRKITDWVDSNVCWYVWKHLYNDWKII